MSRKSVSIQGGKERGLETELVGGDEALRRAEVLIAAMSPARKRRINRWLAGRVASFSQVRTKQQMGLDGSPWAQRKYVPGKPVLEKIADRKRLLIYSDAGEGTVTYRDTGTGIRAMVHQAGISMRMSALRGQAMREMKLADGRTAKQSPPTRRQRSALEKLDVNLDKTRPLNWLRAGAIIKTIRRKRRGSENRPRKDSWEVPIPERSFLGATDKERKRLRLMYEERFLKGFLRKLAIEDQYRSLPQ